MEITGIICEFNPFHNGHKKLLSDIKNNKNDALVICLMSGHFVQRGEPALLSRKVRTEAALLSGADLVAELPVCYSLQSAEGFARGGISVFNDLNCVDTLSFGSECGDIRKLTDLADQIIDNDISINEEIRSNLSSGINYGKILSGAISEHCDNAVLLDEPNNMLGVEYIKALKKTGSGLIPATYKRTSGDNIKSAAAIRKMISNGNMKGALDYIPIELKKLYSSYDPSGYVRLRDFWNVICYKLRTQSPGMDKILGITEGFENKLTEAALDSKCFDDFIKAASLKRFSGSRLNRILCSILLDIKKEDVDRNGNKNYFRILGYKKDASGLVSEICRSASCPVVIKAGELKEISQTNIFAKKDILASDLYYMAARQAGRNEFTDKLIVL